MSSRLIFTCARNEGPFLLEWVGYHRAIGFDEVLIFTNDCEDGTEAIADRLQTMGLAHHERNAAGPDRGPQWVALRSAALARALFQADWAAHLDIDEFLTVFAGKGRLDDLLNAGAETETDAIAVPWRFFGSAGRMAFEDRPVTEVFVDAGPYPAAYPRVGLMFKSLFRPAKFAKPGVHAPRAAKGKAPRWHVADGRAASADFAPHRSMLVGPDAGNRLAQINHYAVKSADSFLVKSARCLPNKQHLAVDLVYWVARNMGGVEDRRLADRGTAARALAELKADPELARLHGAACDWHRAKAAAMLETKEGLALYGGLAMAGPSRMPAQVDVARIYGAMNRVFAGQGKA